MRARLSRGGIAIGVIAAVVVAACGSVTTTASPAPAAGASLRGAGGELKILYWQAPTILNPHQANGTKDIDASRLVIEPLASWGPDARPVANGLATEIPTVANGGVSTDLTTVTWKLRPGLKWSDGSAVTADDVAFTFDYSADPKTAASFADDTIGVKSVVATDAGTVVISYAQPNPNFYQWGVGITDGILQRSQFGTFIGEKAKDAPGNLRPVGTGPYRIVDFRPGDVVQFELNPNFRDPNKPYFKTVTLKGGGDAASAARAVFQTGDADYAWNLQVPAGVLRPMIDASTKAKLLTAYSSTTERIVINFADPDPRRGDLRSEPSTTHPFFSDPVVRKALAMATDRKIVAQQLYGDGLSGRPGCNIVTGVPAYESTATASFCGTFDVAGAAKLLDEGGWKLGADGIRWKSGVKLLVIFQTTVSDVRQKTQEILKTGWEKAGFKVELKAVPPAVFFTNTSPDGANHFWADLEMFTSFSAPDPTNYLNAYTSGQATGKANNWNSSNYARYQNPHFDALIDELRRGTDPAKRASLIKQANDILILDVVVIPIVWRTQITSGVSNALKGVVASGWDSEMWDIADWTK